MRYAFCLPQHFADGAFDPDGLRSFLVDAERFGFEGVWVTEQLFGRMPGYSPLELLSYAAACTDRLRLGCAVFVTPLHNPVHLAKALATLDQLSRGRLDVGVGIGGPNRMFSAFAVDPADGLVGRFTEGLTIMKALWTEPEVTVDGRFWQLHQAPMQPKPFRKPHPPIWFGAGAPTALRRAVRHGDAFMGAGSSTTDAFARQVEILRAECVGAGRNPDEFPIAKRVYIAVDDDADRARTRIDAALVDFYGERFGSTLPPVAVADTPTGCAAELRRVVAAGAQMILLNPLFDAGEQMHRLATEVLPRVDTF